MADDSATVVENLLTDAVYARELAEQVREQERVAVVCFIDEARKHDWPWSRIGKALNISDNAARSYYERNNEKVAQ